MRFLYKKISVILFLIFFISACSEKIPEVNVENCKRENIVKIKKEG
ncbi:entry exclusion lipoprotein TrbK [Acinetobacter colistiniresistens]|uniref:Entry exclusion lipoprotein TrbK n=1 Tax=Acinetobacter colistiniresistens TaxID=280145 RepID=A0A558FBS3_9GAMM|nr:entry exclusion lipoprotein TrbK [Acinetobacter colistiniresistens]TVT82948.1 entry exclusion lipoprotein TrbK [Acinetobacter colistiniresistens]